MKTWIICDENCEYKDLKNRTNNGLERYNRDLNEKFPTPYPPLLTLITRLEEEARYQVQRLEDSRYGKVKRAKLQGLTIEEIPLIYYNFNA